MNFGTFSGRLGRDAATKIVGDTTVTNFSIGVSTYKSGEKSTLWVSAAMWGERGQKLEQYLVKGAAVTVGGDVDVRAYSAKDGTPKAEITCNVQRITLQGSREGGEERPASAPVDTSARRDTSNGRPSSTKESADPGFDDALPF